MNDHELEALLRQASPEGPPARWKQEILRKAADRRGENGFPTVPAWGLLAACWVVILGLRLTTPAMERGGGVALDRVIENRAALLLALGFGETGRPPEPKPSAPTRQNHNHPTPPQAALELRGRSLT